MENRSGLSQKIIYATINTLLLFLFTQTVLCDGKRFYVNNKGCKKTKKKSEQL